MEFIKERFKKLGPLKTKYQYFLVFCLFFFVSVLPLSANVYIYEKAKSSCENEVKNEIQKKTNELMSKIDKILYLNEYDVSNLQSRNEYKELTLIDRNTSLTSYGFQIFKLQEAIHDIKSFNMDYKEIFVIFPNSELAVSSGYWDSPDRFYEYYYDKSELSFYDWKDSMSQNYYAKCNRIIDGDGDEVLEFMYKMPLYNKVIVDAMIVFRIDFSSLQSLIDDETDRVFYVYDRAGNEVFISKGAAKYPTPVIKDGEFVNASEFDADSFVIFSNYNKYTYLTIFPDSIYNARIQYVRLLNIINFIFSIAISLLLFYTLIKKYYLNVSRTINKFEKRIDKYEDLTDVEIINTVFDDYISVRRKYNLLRENAAYHDYFKKLLRGSASCSSIANDYGIVFKCDSFCVGCFKITDVNKMTNDSDFQYIYTVIQNIFEELINKKYCCYVTHVDETITVLFNIDSDQVEQFYEFLSENTKVAGKTIKNNFDFEFVLCVSSCYTGGDAISDAYKEVCAMMRYRSVSKKEDGLLIYDMSNHGFSNIEKELTQDFFEKSKNMIKFIKCGDYEAAKSILNMITDKYFNTRYEVMQIFISDIEGELLRIIYSMNISNAEKYYDELNNLMNIQLSEELFEALSKLIEKLCGEIKNLHEDADAKNKSSRGDFAEPRTENAQNIIFSIVEYINCNYASNDLNIATIGDRFNVAPYYISNKFKQVMNISMVDYINKVRVEKAKEILENIDQPIFQTAESVGFNNIKTFMRAFMKYEAVTPGKYKSMHNTTQQD